MKAINHRFTMREKILLIVLVAILFLGLYFLLVYYPIKNERAELQKRQGDLDIKKVVADANKSIYDEMQNELKEIYATPVGERTEIPKFDAGESSEDFLRAYFNNIFISRGLNLPNISWGEQRAVEEGSNILARTLNISFSIEASSADTDEESDEESDGESSVAAYSYSLAKTIIGEILSVGEQKKVENDDGTVSIEYVQYRCLMNNVTLSPARGDIQKDAVSVNCSVTFYERTR